MVHRSASLEPPPGGLVEALRDLEARGACLFFPYTPAAVVARVEARVAREQRRVGRLTDPAAGHGGGASASMRQRTVDLLRLYQAALQRFRRLPPYDVAALQQLVDGFARAEVRLAGRWPGGVIRELRRLALAFLLPQPAHTDSGGHGPATGPTALQRRHHLLVTHRAVVYWVGGELRAVPPSGMQRSTEETSNG